MHLLIFIIVIILIGFILTASVVRGILGFIFRIFQTFTSEPKQTTSKSSRQQTNTGSSTSSKNYMSKENGKELYKKIFSKEEGEYVDFEEIKDGD